MDENPPWGAGRWIGLTLAALLTAGITAFFDAVVWIGHAGVCGEDSTAHQMLLGRLWLLAILAVTVLAWGPVLGWVRRPGAWAVTGVALLPATLFAVHGLLDRHWQGTFCIPF